MLRSERPSALGEKPTPAQGWLHGLASALPLSHPKGSERQNVGQEPPSGHGRAEGHPMGRAGKGGEGCIPIPRPPFWGRTCHGPRHRGDTRLDHPNPSNTPYTQTKPKRKESREHGPGAHPAGALPAGTGRGRGPQPSTPPSAPRFGSRTEGPSGGNGSATGKSRR